MNKLRIGLILLFVLIGVGVIGIATIQRAQKDDKLEEPTPIQEGVMTGRQKEHGKLYTGFSADSKKLTDFESGGFVIGPGLHVDQPGERITLTDLVRKRTCDSDAIIIGKPISKVSRLTSGGDFIFTDYDVTVQEVLKDDRARSIGRRQIVIVSRPGGKVILNGRVLTVVVGGESPLRAGETYIFFLRRIPATGAYTELEGSSLIPNAGSPLVKISDRLTTNELFTQSEADSIINLVRTQGSIPCSSKL